MKKAIIIGASSGIGRELSKQLVSLNYKVGVVARRKQLLERLQASFPESIVPFDYDCTQEKNFEKLDALSKVLDGVSLVVLCAGVGDLNETLAYPLEAKANQLNVIAFTEIVNWSYHYFKEQKAGHLVVVSSIAGIRGGRVAPAYNASKAYQSNYLEGLQQKVSKEGLSITITDIRAGFVDTDMAKGEGIFWKAPVKKAVQQIIAAIDKKKHRSYVTKRWRIVACALMLLPNFLYIKM